jgi:hypothetical protein
MDILRTFEVNGRILKIVSTEPETAAAPSVLETRVIAPGTRKFEIGPLKLSAEKIAPGESLSLSAPINGENIAFIYTEILFRDKDLNQYYGPVSQEYVLSRKNEQVQGVIYPVWDTDINLSYTITPTLRVLTDGVVSAFAFTRPVNYGQGGYLLDGIFVREDAIHPRHATLKFDDAGKITSALVFKEKGERSIPNALTFKAGDQFTPFVQILTRPSVETPVWQAARGISTALTWRQTPFHCVNETLIMGDYLLGLAVQDLDGELTRQYAPFKLSD